MLDEMKAGFDFVMKRRTLLLLTFLAFAGTFLGMPIVTFMPVVAKDIFALDATGYASMLTVYGVGSVVGALLVAATAHQPRKGRLALMLQLMFALLLLAFGLSRSLPFSMVLAGLGLDNHSELAPLGLVLNVLVWVIVGGFALAGLRASIPRRKEKRRATR